jgi:hypothetical protein
MPEISLTSLPSARNTDPVISSCHSCIGSSRCHRHEASGPWRTLGSQGERGALFASNLVGSEQIPVTGP